MSVIGDMVDEERAWDAVSLAAAAVAGIAVRRLLEAGWQQWREEEAPKNPAARSVDWHDALTWTIASGVAVGVARLLARRGLAEGWRRVRGDYPEGMG